MIRVKALGYIYKRGFENKNFWNYNTGFIRHKNCKHLVDFLGGKKVTALQSTKVTIYLWVGGWGLLTIVDYVCWEALHERVIFFRSKW